MDYLPLLPPPPSTVTDTCCMSVSSMRPVNTFIAMLNVRLLIPLFSKCKCNLVSVTMLSGAMLFLKVFTQ